MESSLAFIILLGTASLAWTDSLAADNGQLENDVNGCDLPFVKMRDRCILVDKYNTDIWEASKRYCELKGGRLLKLDDAELLYEVANYINSNNSRMFEALCVPFSVANTLSMSLFIIWVTYSVANTFCLSLFIKISVVHYQSIIVPNTFMEMGTYLDDVSYWIGGTNKDHEDEWQWTDGSAMRMGIPFWANWGQNGRQILLPNNPRTDNCLQLFREAHYYFDDCVCDAIHSVICEK